MRDIEARAEGPERHPPGSVSGRKGRVFPEMAAGNAMVLLQLPLKHDWKAVPKRLKKVVGGDELGGQAPRPPEPSRGGRQEYCQQGTFQKNTLFICTPETPGELGRGQPTGWVSAQVVIVWHPGPGRAGPGRSRCEDQV